MMREPDRDTELRTLLEALCEESITPEQMARLEAMMMADPGAEILYLEFMQIQSDLLREFGGARSGADLSGPDPGQSGVEDVLQPASSSLRLGGRLAPGNSCSSSLRP